MNKSTGQHKIYKDKGVRIYYKDTPNLIQSENIYLPKRSWNVLKTPDKTKLTGKYCLRAPKSISNVCSSTLFA